MKTFFVFLLLMHVGCLIGSCFFIQLDNFAFSLVNLDHLHWLWSWRWLIFNISSCCTCSVCPRSSLLSSSTLLAFELHFFLVPFSFPYWFINYSSLFCFVCVCLCVRAHVCMYICFRFYGMYTSLSYHAY